MLDRVCHRLRPQRPRRLLIPALVLMGCGIVALVGSMMGDPRLSGGGLGVLAGALPPALLYAYAVDRPADDGTGGDEPGGGPDAPREPDPGDGGAGIDWPAFDVGREAWERVRATT